MQAWWLPLPLTVVLALAAWISAIDATGDATATWLLWAATAFAGSVFAIRMLIRGR